MTTDNCSRAPLDGIKVLDFTRVLAGPYLTMVLGDLGADIIKIESPGTGDDARLYQPPGVAGESCLFLSVNRHKKSVVIDISIPEGQDLCRQLAAQADILVENFRPDVMQRHGLHYAALAAVNPRLIYCSISGYGHDSPFRLVAGYDQVAQAEGGLMYLTGDPAGEPVRAGAGVMDTFTGVHAGLAILAALHARHQSGRGQFIDLSLFDTTLAITGFMGQMALATGQDPPRTGNGAITLCPCDVYHCADNALMLVCGNDRQYRRLCLEVFERPDLLDDPRYSTNRDRVANRGALEATVKALFQQQTRDYWIARLRAAGVPAGSVRTPLEALTSAEATARHMVQEVQHPKAGIIKTVASPMRLSATPVRPPSPAPLLSQHTETVLRQQLGLDEEALAALRTVGAIPSDSPPLA
ncbi:MAG: CoA transferase [bacterium]|nr:CoA transferase [bacterium]